jgi:hypothetical protein
LLARTGDDARRRWRPLTEEHLSPPATTLGGGYCAGIAQVIAQVLRRFSDAGTHMLTTRSGGRRPKSAKARNRGGLGTKGAALWGFSLER